MSDDRNPSTEDTGQVSVAELLARNGQRVGDAGGRRRRGVAGGISVAELTGEIPVVPPEAEAPPEPTPVPESTPVPEPAPTPRPVRGGRPTPAPTARFRPTPARTEFPAPRPDTDDVDEIPSWDAGPVDGNSAGTNASTTDASTTDASTTNASTTNGAGPTVSSPNGSARDGKTVDTRPSRPVERTRVVPAPLRTRPPTPVIEDDDTDVHIDAITDTTPKPDLAATEEFDDDDVVAYSDYEAESESPDDVDEHESSGYDSSGYDSKDAAVTRRAVTVHDDLDADDDPDTDSRDEPANPPIDRNRRSPARQWLSMIGQGVVAVVLGALLFKGFERLWDVLPWVALVLSFFVIVGLVAVVRVLRRTDDIVSILLAVLVGSFVTLGPLAFMLSTT